MNIESMKQRILMLLLGCFLVMGALAQNSGITKQINDIKRDGRYFYAESTMETEEEAREAATLMLTNYINDYINDKKLPPESKVTEQGLTKAQYIKGKRGTNMRVFVYVNKADYVPFEPVGEAAPLESKVEPIAAPEPVETSEPVATPAVSEPVVTESTVASESSSDASIPLLVEWQQEAVNEMLTKPNLQGVISVLNRMKVDYKVKRFGTYNECKNIAECFWVILENDADKSLVTILGPGTSDRVNFRTRQYDSLDNYFGKGKGAVWFEFSK
ncbi:hypothetical protein DXB65_11235 [Bacteroides oleiciplenus]|uniref:Uncharacterized protein n=2 Tax=Bacteroides oleiciplenus TaxID=626931 RepID=A0A3E5BCC6_9BACE|nr:hypothetical protein DXB65_11235 [Bacteroides oleiciplenus]